MRLSVASTPRVVVLPGVGCTSAATAMSSRYAEGIYVVAAVKGDELIFGPRSFLKAKFWRRLRWKRVRAGSSPLPRGA